jgi:hypothetical protein
LRLLAFLILFGLCGTAAADTVTFRDIGRTISFSYEDKLWQKSDRLERGSLIWIERRLLGGETIAVCRLRAKKTAYAASIDGQVHQAREHIVAKMMKSERARDPETPLIESSPVTVGSQQMIELRQDHKNSSVDAPNRMTMIAVYTVHRGEEILFQCGYSSYFRRIDGKEPFVESEVRAVIETLSFGN